MKRINPWWAVWFLAILPIYLFAQKPPIKPGKISMEEMLMEKCAFDTNARAMIICDYGRSFFNYTENLGFQLQFERIMRVKIFNSDGYDWADHAITLWKSPTSKEKIVQLKCATYNLVDGKIEKEKLKNSDVFTEEVNKKKDRVKFSMPQVKAGSVIELEYTIASDFYFNLNSWYFQYDIPAEWSEYIIEIPEFFTYKRTMKGYISLDVNESSSQRKSIMMSSKSRSGGLVTKTNYDMKTYDYSEEKDHWIAKNVPAFIAEEPLTTKENYISKLVFELGSYNPPYGQVESYTRSWEDINDFLMDDADFGGQLNGGGFLKEPVEDINSKADSPYDRMVAAYRAIQRHMRWNGNNALYASDNLRTVFDEQAGNSADINLILVLLLNKLEIEADPVALSTRSHGIIYLMQPTVTGLDHVIAMATIDGQQYLMDATDPMVPFGLLPKKDLNGNGRLISKKKSEWVNLDTEKSYKAFSMYNLSMDDDLAFSGNIQSAYNDYAALRKRDVVKGYTSEDEYIKAIEDNHAGLVIENFELINRTEYAEPFKEKFEVSISDQTIGSDEVIYFNPMLYDAVSENPYKLEERKYPVEFAFPTDISTMFTFTIPEGYKVDEFPQSSMVKLPDGAGAFVYSASVMGNTLQIMSKIQINKKIFLPEEYDFLKSFYNHIIAKHSEQVVLSKL